MIQIIPETYNTAESALRARTVRKQKKSKQKWQLEWLHNAYGKLERKFSVEH